MSAVSSGFGIGAAVTAAIRHTPRMISARVILPQISIIYSEKENYFEKNGIWDFLFLGDFCGALRNSGQYLSVMK